MINDAEKYKEEDEKNKKFIEGKNELENLMYSVKNTISDEKLKDKFSEEEKNSLELKVKDTQEFLDSCDASSTTLEEITKVKKELEDVSNPIMSKLYNDAAAANGGMPGGMPSETSTAASPPEEPKIEEVA